MKKNEYRSEKRMFWFIFCFVTLMSVVITLIFFDTSVFENFASLKTFCNKKSFITFLLFIF